MKIPITIQKQAGVLIPNTESDRKGVFIYTRVDNNSCRNVHLQRVWKPIYKGKDTPWTYYRQKLRSYEKTTKYVGSYFNGSSKEPVIEVLEVIAQMYGLHIRFDNLSEQSIQAVQNRLEDVMQSDVGQENDKTFTEKELQEYY